MQNHMEVSWFQNAACLILGLKAGGVMLGFGTIHDNSIFLKRFINMNPSRVCLGCVVLDWHGTTNGIGRCNWYDNPMHFGMGCWSNGGTQFINPTFVHSNVGLDFKYNPILSNPSFQMHLYLHSGGVKYGLICNFLIHQIFLVALGQK